MSAIGDYIYFTWEDYQKGAAPPKLYSNSLKQKDAKTVFEKKKQQIINKINSMQDYRDAATREKYFNLVSQFLAGKTTTFTTDEAAFIKNFETIFKNNMSKSNYDREIYNFIGKGDVGYVDYSTYLQQKNINAKQKLTEIIKDQQNTGRQWLEILKELRQVLKSDSGTKYAMGALGANEKDIKFYQSQLNKLISIFGQLSKIAKSTKSQIQEIIESNELKSRDGSKINTTQMDALIEWLQAAAQPGNKVNFMYHKSGLDYDLNIFTGIRYLSHIYFHPSNYAKAQIVEILNTSIEQTAVAIGLDSIGPALATQAYSSGTHAGFNMIKKEDLTTKLADKLYIQGKKLAEVEINGQKWIKTSRTQNKMDVSISYEIYNDENFFTEKTLGNSVKKTEDIASSNFSIRGFTKGNLYNVIGNDNDNLFLTHYVNIFALKTKKYERDLPPDKGNVESKVKAEGDLAMKLIYAYRGFTGDGIPKYNMEIDYGGNIVYTPVSGATMLDIYDAATQRWKIQTMSEVLGKLIKDNNKLLNLLSISGDNFQDPVYASNFYPINTQPYIPEELKDKNIGVIRRRINATIDYIHNTNISIALNSARKIIK